MQCDGLFEGTKFYGAVGMHILSLPLSDEQRRPDPLTGYHVLLTAPFFDLNPDKNFSLEDFYLSTIRLSALAWRRYNGPIYLLTDHVGKDYFQRNGFDKIYNGILPILDADMYGIDHQRYWASGKIQALGKIHAPFVIIDLDLIVWRVLDVTGFEVAAAHTENISINTYPGFSFFDMSKKYQFPNDWDETTLPLNTSIMYFKDDAFKNYYASSSIRFMKYERNSVNDGIRCMVFAEQRILGFCAKAKNKVVKTFLDYENPLEKQNLITHLWSCKSFLKHDPEIAQKYCALCEEKSALLARELTEGKF